MPLPGSSSEQLTNNAPERALRAAEHGVLDVFLIHPPGRSEVAALLADATTAAGYTIAREEVDNPQLLGTIVQQRNAKATLLVWSRELVTAIGREDWLRKLRGRSLIEISVDGLEPPGEGVQVEFLSGWRGQQFHPGWQAIRRRIEHLCGSHQVSRKGPVEMMQRLLPRWAGAARRWPAEAMLSWKRRPFLLAALTAITVAATAWFLTLSQDLQRPKPAGQTAPSALALGSGVSRPMMQRAADHPPQPAAPAMQAAPHSSTSPREPSAAGEDAMSIREASTPPAAAPAAPEPVVPPPPLAGSSTAPSSRLKFPALTRTTEMSRPAAKRRVQARAKRYSRQHSQTMRLFCQRSGRSTAECRIFRRSTRMRRL